MTSPSSPIPVLGRLEIVEPRSVWPHEARSFTPWLLANADVLSELLGMDLELHTAEHPVGNFSLDLIGRDLATDQVVIVENQLETSDHAHLGQILTYAAGTNPATIVWTAPAFRPEHRAALDWLNARTDEHTRFFGVEIKVMRIGDSAPAPAFSLVAQPNDWEKVVRSSTHRSTEPEPGKVLYRRFWEAFYARLADEHPGWTRGKSRAASWVGLGTGMPASRYYVWFTKGGLSSEINLEDGDIESNSRRMAELYERRAELEAAYGGPLTFVDMPGKTWSRISDHQVGPTIENELAWPEYMEWAIERQVRLRKAFAAIGGLSAPSRESVSEAPIDDIDNRL